MPSGRRIGMTASSGLSLRERLSYGFGDMGFSLAYNMASGFLLLYYVNVVKCLKPKSRSASARSSTGKSGRSTVADLLTWRARFSGS